MTRSTNARVAGITFLMYIVLGIGSMVLFGRIPSGDVATVVQGYAAHAPEVNAAIVLTLLCAFAAIVLGVTMYAITRDEDPDLAMLGLTCRTAEGVVNGISVLGSLGLLWLATTTGPDAPSADGANSIAAFLLGQHWYALISASFFALGSLFFSWLLLRGRMIPAWMAWLGVIASILLTIGLPLRLGGMLPGTVVQFLWLPMALFEIPLGIWFIVKGVRAPQGRAV